MTRFTHCIVHAGTHKTGTTTVQDILAAHRTHLAASGFLYPAIGHKRQDHNPLAHRLATCTDDELASVREHLTGRSARAGVRLGDPSRLLLSAEEFSTRICNSDPWAGFTDEDYWEQRRRYLSRLRHVLPEAAQVEVFVCFRDHESYAHTLYATKVLSGLIDCSFAQFVRRCAPIFDYRRQVDVLAQTLGSVRVESFEQLRSDLANRLFAWLGLPIQVEQTARLRPTPSLDLIYWLATSQQSPQGRRDHKQRAAFCKAHGPRDAAGGAVDSLWLSAQDRQDFVRQCHPPPLDGWPPMHASGHIVEAAALDHRAAQVEAEYQRWLQHHGGRRKHWMFFWRRP